MSMKKVIRKAVRTAIGARERENISDALIRKRIKVEKLFYRKKYSTAMLEAALRECGITDGDIVMVHCSWRSMYNYDSSPEDVIDMLEELVGESGTILMPSYGPDRNRFDVDQTPSSAGVLSEVFRRQPDVQRSACTHFSIAGTGRDADAILSDHINSRYGFDEHSPCFKLGEYPNGKVLFLGLGAEPTKISVFHCAGAKLRGSDEKLKKLLSREYESELILQGVSYIKKMYYRLPGHENDKASFKTIFRSLQEKGYVKLSNLDIVVINAQEAIRQAVVYAGKGIYCYKNMDRL